MPEFPIEPPIFEMLVEDYENLTSAQKLQLATQKTYWQNQGFEVRIGPRQKPH